MLVRPADLIYTGAFNVPGGIKAGGQANMGFEHGGTALAFDASRPGLYMVGHDWDQLSGEISIPAIGETATVLQSLTDVTDDTLDQIGPGAAKIGGQLVCNGQLYMTGFLFYDGAASQTVVRRRLTA